MGGIVSLFTMENPVFVTYVIAAALMVLKIMLQGWDTVFRMIRSDSGLLNPEDLQAGPANRNPRPEQLERNDYVDRSRRIHRNDLENILPFLVAGLLFVAVNPPLWLAQVLMYAFVVVRVIHSWTYGTRQRHEVRATFYSIGSVIVIFMAAWSLSAALS
jgi:uncharacterized MAPEG superfamily protein